MCGRFAQAKLDWPSYFELFGDIEPPDLPVSFNVKPTQDIAMAYNRPNDQPRYDPLTTAKHHPIA